MHILSIPESTYKDQNELDVYIDALITEIKFKSSFFKNETIDCIYIGGGTPSLMGEKNLEKLIHAIKENYNLLLTEFTLKIEAKEISKNLLEKTRALLHVKTRLIGKLSNLFIEQFRVLFLPGFQGINR